jgi:DNA-binding NarL/FixJ family response regulator
MPLRLLIVDDNERFLEAARGLLEADGVRVVGVASTVAEALDRHARLRPDVTLVDVNLGEESGLELARLLAGPVTEPLARVILISTYPEEDLVDLLEALPVIGFVTKARLSASAVSDLVGTFDRRAGGGP